MADQLESESAAALLTFKNGGITYNSIKQEEDTSIEIEAEEPTTLEPAALGLQRVGEEVSPRPASGLVLNRRGMPARIRKKNRRLFFDENMVTPVVARCSPKKPPVMKGAPKKPKLEVVIEPVVTSPDKKVAQKIGVRLRNLLKLPKAHKWVCYEWFYSNIDKPLFEGDNDFMICLKESFPQLKTRKLTRVEWCKIRRMMGKPRRCSQAFFEEERRELELKRQKIRLLQQRKTSDVNHLREDLPDEIPLQLVIGTKVTARLRKPQDGLFTGSIDAVDTSDDTYRITFERPGLGTHSVRDFEVLSNEPPETILVSSFAQKFRPRQITPYSPRLPSTSSSGPVLAASMDASSAASSPASHLHSTNDPLLTGPLPVTSPTTKAIAPAAQVCLKNRELPAEGTLGGFPVPFLEMIVRLSKILTVKKEKITQLREMNSEAERMKSYGAVILPEDFQQRYAGIVIELDHLNRDLKGYLKGVQHYCQEVAPEPSLAAMLAPSRLRERCRDQASDIVQRFAKPLDQVKSPGIDRSIYSLITDLTSLMLQVKNLADADRSAYEMKVLQGSLDEIREKLKPENQQCFQNCVEVHLQHIQTGFGQMGSLNHSFSAQKT
ncbi:protein lin-9 homolog [Ischnura elegans]|uniref:protein lin-9 homolog n=1 Tax=Ischnura elegans TaxID=197161 RepID=UPI001ED89A70|nr:protein lin-9 homolog [Ischnura elegans]